MAEQQLRIFEPDPLSITSIDELESCEKNLLDTLTRVTEKKKDLLSSHFSTYDPASVQVYFEAQEGVPTSFENEVASWLPTDNAQNPTQICVGSESSYIHPNPIPEPSTIYDIPVSQGTNLNVDPCNMGGCQIGNETDGLPTWHHNYTTTELLSAFMSPSSLIPSPIIKVSSEAPKKIHLKFEGHERSSINIIFGVLQHEIAEPGLPPMMAQQQVEAASRCHQMPVKTQISRAKQLSLISTD
ncbi:hypothetical protein TorRG33x02_251450 [Trema orientale]|uniref:Uncharacterized protein n=1 Tax=Trema orientale TaxID=63057 RepID=A0A2P5DGY4_TREOI|nr:hypothetical protein TorRG33x02_251450 [Trema orientale]